MQQLRLVAMILVVVGALNWGLVALTGLNVVNILLGGVPMVERIVYILVGLGGVLMLVTPETWRRPSALA